MVPMFLFFLASAVVCVGLSAYSPAASETFDSADTPRRDSMKLVKERLAMDSTRLADSIYAAEYHRMHGKMPAPKAPPPPISIEQQRKNAMYDSMAAIHPHFRDSVRAADSMAAFRDFWRADSIRSADSIAQKHMKKNKR